MEGTSPKDKLESTYTTALSKNWMVWPWVQAINFKLVPLEHRVLVVNIVSLGECCSGLYSLEGEGTNVFDDRVELLPKLHQQQGGQVMCARSSPPGITWRLSLWNIR